MPWTALCYSSTSMPLGRFVCYVAKDKDTKVRECHVFDCGDFADEVLATLGQAFVLAADLKSQKKKPGTSIGCRHIICAPLNM